MRISDWSSDVCSSDLAGSDIMAARHLNAQITGDGLNQSRQRYVSSYGAASVRLQAGTPKNTRRPSRRLAIQALGGVVLCGGLGLSRRAAVNQVRHGLLEIGRASCRERVCQ